MTAPDRRESFPYSRKDIEQALLFLLAQNSEQKRLGIIYSPARVEPDEDSLSVEAKERNANRSFQRKQWAARIRSVYHTVQFNGDKPSLVIKRNHEGKCFISLKQ